MSGEAIKPGYKRTEVGVIPEDWEVRQLSEHFQIYAGGDVPKSSLSQFRSESHPHPIFANALQNNGLYGFTAERRAKADSVTVTARGYLGHAEYRAEEFFPIVRLLVLEPIGSLDAKFTAFAINERVKFAFESTGVPQLTAPQVGKYSVAAPPVPEQRAIAGALSDVDNLLAKLDQLIAKKRDLKQATMQQLLTGQTRLPGFSGEWMVKTLFDLAERKKELFDDGDWIESEHITNAGIRLIQTGNIGVGGFVEKEAKKFIFEKSFTSLRCKQLKTGDLLLCRLAAPAGRACVLPDIGEERIVTSVDVTIFRPPVEVANRIYLANLFSTPEWFQTVSDRCGGTTHKRISRGALGRIAIKLPPLPEQTAIATMLSDMDAELASLETRRDKALALKQGMMQELLTGKIRLL